MVYSSDFYTSRRPAYYKPSTSYSYSLEDHHREHGQPKSAAFTRNTVRVPWHKVPNVPRPSQVPMPYLVFGRRGDPETQKRCESLEAGTETDVETETKELIRSALARRHLHETETIPSKSCRSSNRYRVDADGHEGHTRRRILFSTLPPTTYRY